METLLSDYLVLKELCLGYIRDLTDEILVEILLSPFFSTHELDRDHNIRGFESNRE